MGYFKEKADLKFLEDFKSELERYYVYKNTVDNSLAQSPLLPHMYSQAEPALARQLFEDYDDYQALRTQIAKDKNRAHRIGHSLGVGIGVTSYPAPAVGGPVLRFNVFDAVLRTYPTANA